MVATPFDAIARRSPKGVCFKRYAEERGLHGGVRRRDSGELTPSPTRR